MYFINAVSLDTQGRINLSKFFQHGDKVITTYDDVGDYYELFNAEALTPLNEVKAFAQASVVDGKGRIFLPVWARRLAGANAFLVSAKVRTGFEDTYSVILKPAGDLANQRFATPEPSPDDAGDSPEDAAASPKNDPAE